MQHRNFHRIRISGVIWTCPMVRGRLKKFKACKARCYSETPFCHQKHTHPLTYRIVWWIPSQYESHTCSLTHPSCFFLLQWIIRKAESMRIHVCMSQSCSSPSPSQFIRMWIFILYACYQKDLYYHSRKWNNDIVDHTECRPNKGQVVLIGLEWYVRMLINKNFYWWNKSFRCIWYLLVFGIAYFFISFLILYKYLLPMLILHVPF